MPLPTGFWVACCLACLAVGMTIGVYSESDRVKDKPYEPAGLVQRQDVSLKMAEQTDRLIGILERKCFAEPGFPEDGKQIYDLN